MQEAAGSGEDQQFSGDRNKKRERKNGILRTVKVSYVALNTSLFKYVIPLFHCCEILNIVSII